MFYFTPKSLTIYNWVAQDLNIRMGEHELLRLMADGDEKAFSLLVRRYNSVIYPYLLYWLKEVQIAEEVTQDVFMRIWRNRARLPEMENFSGYLYTIARNCATTTLGQQLSTDPFPAIETVDGLMNNPHASLELKELAILLDTAVKLLPPRRREVFLLSRNEGLTYEEIAVRLKIARSTVNEHMVAALVFLRYYLRQHAGVIVGWLIAIGLFFWNQPGQK